MSRIISFFLLLLFFSFGGGKNDGIKSSYQDGKLSLEILGGKSLFPDEFLQYLEQGIVFSFIYKIKIEKRGLIWNAEILSKKVERQFYYDYWTESFVFKDDGSNILEYFQSARELVKRLAQIEDLKIESGLIEKGEKYHFSIETQLNISNMKGFFYTLFVMYSHLRYSKVYSDDEIIGD